jgi:hypothetical protein
MLCIVFGVRAADYTSNLQTLVLDDFEMDGEDSEDPKILWKVIPNTFGREGNRPNGKSMQRIAWIKAWPEAYFGNSGSFFFGTEDSDTAKQRYTDVSNHCLGINIKFNRQGYNNVDLYPIKKVEKKSDEEGEEESESEDDGEDKYEITTLPFKGKVSQFDFWVWGSNYDYYLEVVVMDYRGVQHRLKVGSLKHIGWKNFNVVIPKQIPQRVDYIPQERALSLVKFTIWTMPTEKVNGSTIYFDHIKYLTDVYEDIFDGYELGVTSKVEELWKEGEKEDIKVNYLP